MNNEKCASKNSCGTNKSHIQGIKCDVKNCVYHDCDTYCTAGQIAVGKTMATDAVCDTFKERK
mgnify:CR=1 FL=1